MATKTTGTAQIVEEAAQWVAAGRPDQAAQLYNKALDLEPGDSRTRMQLAACLVDCGLPNTAAAEYITVAREYASARRTTAEALAISQRILKIDALQFSYTSMAEVMRAVGRDGVSLCQQAARAHHAVRRDDEAAALLQLASELDPLDTDALYELAQLYLNHEMPSEAAESLRIAGRRLLAVGNDGRYIEFARAILTIEPDDLETLRELPRAYVRKGEPQQAVVQLSSLLRANPGDMVGYETLAHAFATAGQATASLMVLKQLTLTLASSGYKDSAESIIERALQWRADDDTFRRSVIEMRMMQPSPSQPIFINESAATVEEATAVLSLSHLTRGVTVVTPAPEEDGVFDATDLVELDDGEDSVVLRLSDLSRVDSTGLTRSDEFMPDITNVYGKAVPKRRESSETGSSGGDPTASPEATQSLDLRDIIDLVESGEQSIAPRIGLAPRGDTKVGLPPGLLVPDRDE